MELEFRGEKTNEKAFKPPIPAKKFLLFKSKMKYLNLETESKFFSSKTQFF